MRALVLAAALIAAPAAAQSHDHHAMAAAPADPAPPAPPGDWAADRVHPSAEMAAARRALFAEHGGMAFSQLMVNIAEFGARKGRDGYRWDAEAWHGGDIDRLTLKTEGEGAVGRKVERAELQALWSHALDPYWNLQLGARQDLGRSPRRSYATIGVEGLAPYWFEVEGALFLSAKGDLLGRVEAYYDQRITQRLVLQPRVEANLSAQRVPASRLGKGLTDIEAGLRLRYEIARELAPYLGLSHERRLGRAADLARAAGDGARSTRLVVGIRFWL